MSSVSPPEQQPAIRDPGRRSRVAVVSILVNGMLSLCEIVLGLVVGSMAMVADAIHSFTDMVVSAMVLLGVWIGNKKPQQAHLVENLIALVISALIMFAAVRIVIEVSNPKLAVRTEWLPVAIVMTFIFALTNWGLARYQSRVGLETGSLSLIADSRHTSMDMMTSFMVILALMGQVIGLRLDRLAGALIGIFVGIIALEIGITALLGLFRQTGWAAGGRGHIGSRTLSSIGRTILGPRLWSWAGRRRRAVVFSSLMLALILWLLTGLTTVGPSEVGLKLRWGKYTGEPMLPGLHWLAPAPIDSIVLVEPDTVGQLEIGFRSKDQVSDKAAALRTNYEWDSLHKAGIFSKQFDEALNVTGDENMLDINVVVQYSMSDPAKATLGIRDQASLVKGTVEATLHETLAGRSFEQVLVADRREIEAEVRSSVQQDLDTMNSGIRVLGVYLQDVHPPIEVVSDFRDVYAALEDKEKTINDAEGYRNENIARARGEAYRTLVEADAYVISKSNNAEGDAERFRLSAEAYRTNRALHSFRLSMETMEKALAGRRKIIVPGDLRPGAVDLRFIQPNDTRGQR